MKIMPLLDIISAFMIFLHISFHLFSINTMLYVALYLITKGIIFSFFKDFASFVDLFCGFYILVFLFSGVSVGLINIFMMLWLVQKGFFGILT